VRIKVVRSVAIIQWKDRAHQDISPNDPNG
jgi:hypothetical protein